MSTTLLQVSKCLAGGHGLAPVLLQRASSIELDWDVRQKSRFAATDSRGRALAIFLPRGQAVRGGDVLVAEDGSLIHVRAAPQKVLRITACAEHGSPFDLVRAAYHLGNRHVPIELQPDHLKIEPDHVLAEMLRSLHMDVAEVELPFEPEGGAYGGHVSGGGEPHHHHGRQHRHGPGAGPDDGNAPAQGHEHEHEHEHAQHDHYPHSRPADGGR